MALIDMGGFEWNSSFYVFSWWAVWELVGNANSWAHPDLQAQTLSGVLVSDVLTSEPGDVMHTNVSEPVE